MNKINDLQEKLDSQEDHGTFMLRPIKLLLTALLLSASSSAFAFSTPATGIPAEGNKCGNNRIEGNETCDTGHNKRGICLDSQCIVDEKTVCSTTKGDIDGRCVRSVCQPFRLWNDGDADFICDLQADTIDLTQEVDFALVNTKIGDEFPSENVSKCTSQPTARKKGSALNDPYFAFLFNPYKAKNLFHDKAQVLTRCKYTDDPTQNWKMRLTFREATTEYPITPGELVRGERTIPQSDISKLYTNSDTFTLAGKFLGGATAKLTFELLGFNLKNTSADSAKEPEAPVIYTHAVTLKTSDNDLLYEIEIPLADLAVPDGTYLARITATPKGTSRATESREAAKEKDIVEQMILVVDRQAPTNVSNVIVEDDNAGITTLSGTTEQFATVIVRLSSPVGEKFAKEVLADAAGGWVADFDTIAPGTYTYTTEVIDPAKNTSTPSQPASFSVGDSSTFNLSEDGCSSTPAAPSLMTLMLAALAMVGGAVNRRRRKNQ